MLQAVQQDWWATSCYIWWHHGRGTVWCHHMWCQGFTLCEKMTPVTNETIKDDITVIVCPDWCRWSSTMQRETLSVRQSVCRRTAGRASQTSSWTGRPSSLWSWASDWSRVRKVRGWSWTTVYTIQTNTYKKHKAPLHKIAERKTGFTSRRKSKTTSQQQNKHNKRRHLQLRGSWVEQKTCQSISQ